jgi:hypothetical protein
MEWVNQDSPMRSSLRLPAGGCALMLDASFPWLAAHRRRRAGLARQLQRLCGRAQRLGADARKGSRGLQLRDTRVHGYTLTSTCDHGGSLMILCLTTIHRFRCTSSSRQSCAARFSDES